MTNVSFDTQTLGQILYKDFEQELTYLEIYLINDYGGFDFVYFHIYKFLKVDIYESTLHICMKNLIIYYR